MTPDEIDRIWRLAYWLYPDDLQKRIAYFQMRVIQELKK